MAKQVRIGVFIPHDSQFLDAATVDVLGVMSKEYMSLLPPIFNHVADLAPSVTVSYITSPAQSDGIHFTSGLTVKPTHIYTDAEVGPGKLDVVVVPGPDPNTELDQGGLGWLRSHFETPGVDVLSVCTGIFICAAAGIADGRLVSGPRGMQDELKKKYPRLKLAGDKHRWMHDGNLWSSGGVTNGNDLMAAYARTGKHWPLSVVEISLKLTDVGDRGQIYGQSDGLFKLGFAWQLLKSWFAGVGSSPDKADKADKAA